MPEPREPQSEPTGPSREFISWRDSSFYGQLVKAWMDKTLLGVVDIAPDGRGVRYIVVDPTDPRDLPEGSHQSSFLRRRGVEPTDKEITDVVGMFYSGDFTAIRDMIGGERKVLIVRGRLPR